MRVLASVMVVFEVFFGVSSCRRHGGPRLLPDQSLGVRLQ
jgi:hypothetical protein